MNLEIESNARSNQYKKEKPSMIKEYLKYKFLFLLLFPVIIWYLVFCYGPLYGIQLAFKDFNISKGIWGSDWVGFSHFVYMFTASTEVLRVIANTLVISFYHIIFGFPAPIILALALNEMRVGWYKRFTQTITYIPHFLSWIILAGLITSFLSPSTGVVNILLQKLGVEPIYFLANKDWFRFTLVTTNIWKEMGWGTIIYLAALAGIDTQLYEAAVIDGAGRIKQTIYITLPSLMPTIAVMFIFRIGGIMNAGFDQILNLYNPAVYSVADILDTYVYRMGLAEFRFDLSTAVNLFKNVIGLLLVLITDFSVKKMGQDGLL